MHGAEVDDPVDVVLAGKPHDIVRTNDICPINPRIFGCCDRDDCGAVNQDQAVEASVSRLILP